MGLWKNEDTLYVSFVFADGTRDYRTRGGHDCGCLSYPFNGIYYRGDVVAYAKEFVKNNSIRLGNLREKMDQLVSMKVLFQCVSYSRLTLDAWFVSNETGMEEIHVETHDRDEAMRAYDQVSGDFVPRALRAVEEVRLQKKDWQEGNFTGTYYSTMFQYTLEEAGEMFRRKLNTAILETYSPCFCTDTDLVFKGKKFVIAEQEYPKKEHSQGVRLAAKLTALGAKESKTLSKATDYLIFSTTNIQSTDRYIVETDENGQNRAVLYNSGKPKLNYAIEYQQEGGKIRIITMDFLETLLGE